MVRENANGASARAFITSTSPLMRVATPSSSRVCSLRSASAASSSSPSPMMGSWHCNSAVLVLFGMVCGWLGSLTLAGVRAPLVLRERRTTRSSSALQQPHPPQQDNDCNCHDWNDKSNGWALIHIFTERANF